MLVVVVEHEGADAQVLGRRGGGHQRRHRGELLGEVVGHRERRVAEILDLAGQLDPTLGVVRRRRPGSRSGTAASADRSARSPPATLAGRRCTVSLVTMRAITWICRLGVIALAAALLFGAVIVAIAPRVWGVANSWEGQPLELPALQPLARPTHVYDADGNLIATFQRQNSQPIELAKIPEPVRRAFLVVEDREFYTHNGVNARSLVRAVLSNVASDVPQQGASTITMQVAKNEFLGGIDRDFRYKALQIHYAMMLENQYTKDQILERYLNTVFFGNNAYGVQAAAEAYFGKTVDQLTFVEAAYLAGLVRSPSGYDPIDNPERSRARFAQVVDLLVESGEMTEAEGQSTLDTFEVPARVQTRRADQPDLPRTYFTEALRDYLLNRTAILGSTFQQREAALYRGGLEIHTTLIPGFQQMAEQARDLLPDTQQGFDAAIVSLDTQTGAIVAMVGGRGFVPGENEVNMALAPRQTGSSQKIFILAAALQAGRLARRRHRRHSGRACCPTRATRASRSRSATRRAARPTRCGR